MQQVLSCSCRNVTIFLLPCLYSGGEISSKSELDELQEEVARRAQEQELRRKREKELEAAKGFNPHPSRFMDLDELQNQGNCYDGDRERGKKHIQACKFLSSVHLNCILS